MKHSVIRFSGLADVLFQLIFLGTALLTLGGFWARGAWYWDLMVHYTFWYLVCQGVCLIVFFALRRSRWAVIAMCLLLINAWRAMPYIFPHPDQLQGSVPVRLTHLNVLTSNNQYQHVQNFLLETNADIITLQEIDSVWVAALKPVWVKYPYRVLHPRSDNFGIALLSRFPVSDVHEGAVVEPFGLPTITANIHPPGARPFSLVTLHPLPPLGSQFDDRNRQFSETITVAKTLLPDRILAGDLNCTPYSPFFQDLLKGLNLRDSQSASGYQGTWRVGTGLLIPIDHVLVSPAIRVLNRDLGPEVGSDHLPLVVDLGVPIASRTDGPVGRDGSSTGSAAY